MLKINKILSEKIKSPLSLRGAKQACPCESKGINLNGFSLIELMVAVVILAMAIFGIFHAYSVGFMGMADARDRTVATNYAREAMEDIKNMDFDLITNENLNTPETIDEKFTRVVNVENEVEGDLKKVTTVVSWYDRNGIQKDVKLETLIYNND